MFFSAMTTASASSTTNMMLTMVICLQLAELLVLYRLYFLCLLVKNKAELYTVQASLLPDTATLAGPTVLT